MYSASYSAVRMLSLIPPSTLTYVRRRPRPARRLDRAHLVQRHAVGPTIARPGSTASRGDAQPGAARTRARRSSRSALGDRLPGSRGSSSLDVRDAEPAAEVELRQLDAVLVADLGQQPDARRWAATSNPAVSKICEPMWRVHADQLAAPASASDAPHRLRGRAGGQREPELLVLVRGRDELVGVRLDPDGHPDQHPLPRTPRSAASVGEPDDLLERVEDDPADPGVERRRELGAALVVAVERDPLGREAGAQRDGQLAAGADVEAEALLARPSAPRPWTGTPCRRRTRRAPVGRVRGANAARRAPGSPPRPGRTAACRTSPARSRTSIPPTVIASAPGCRPASRAADRGHTAGSSACNAAGSTGASGAACAATCSPCRGPAGWARMSARLPRRARNGRSGALRAPAGPACWVSQPELQMRSGATTPSHARPAASWLLVAAASQIRAMWPGPTVPHPSGSAGPVASNAR